MQRRGEVSSTVLPWEKFREWIYCVTVVTFDLELGQTIESIYPPHALLCEEEKTSVCYLSFPDSNSGCMGDTQFNFRIRRSGDIKITTKSREMKEYDENSPPALQTHPNYLNGYVYFRQVKDSSLRRGYFQKSVVILSKFSFGNLFFQILNSLAPSYFEKGIDSIESAISQIYQWPPPIPGQTLSLKLFSSLFEIVIPTASVGRLSGSPVKNSLNSNVSFPISVHETNAFRVLSPLLPSLHLLWELVLLSEPIVVMASDPHLASSTVNSLIKLIYPLRYAADFRPYFTIHDTDFKEYTLKSALPPPVILGVTNPFFAKTLQHWPHIVRMGSCSSFSNFGKLKKGSGAKLLDSQPGVYTSYKPFLQNDKYLLKKIGMGMQSQRPEEVQTAIIRRHLHELTESFMIPLERYIASLMPLQKNISPAKAPPLPRPFNPDNFLSTISNSGPQLTSGIKAEWSGLYKRFFRSLNFSHWYNARYREAVDKLQSLHLEAISQTDILSWVEGRDEVEAVDLILKLREQISHTQITTIVRDKLQNQLGEILKSLPEDLQAVLNSNSS